LSRSKRWQKPELARQEFVSFEAGGRAPARLYRLIIFNLGFKKILPDGSVR
jgi:hypothetical protein